MKTRIKVVELNNGEKTFTCQAEDKETHHFNIFIIFMMFVFLTASIMISIETKYNWFILGIIISLWIARKLESPYSIIYTMDDNPSEGIFNNIDEAKKLIDDYLQYIANQKHQEHLKEIKSKQFIKYP